MIILIQDRMERWLGLNIIDLIVYVIFEHVNSNEKMDVLVRRQVEVELFISIFHLKRELIIELDHGVFFIV